MTANRRIFLNFIATYGRSLYALLVGLVCGRWALKALGEIDFGLMGLVGGLIAFVSFFNNILASSIGRFYAFSVGVAQREDRAGKGIEDCRRWFSVAVSIHTVVPLVLMLIGYPLGIWAIESYLTIPVSRVGACIWVFRCVCLSCFLSMIVVPFHAMYTAKQYIAELTIYSFVTSTLNALFLYYMVNHPGVWLTQYAFWTCLLAVIPLLIISIRAYVIFPECRILSRHLYNLQDIRELISFAGWNVFGALGNLAKSQGILILVNKMLGPVFNASMSIANTVSGHTHTLSGSIVSAFIPAITTARGAEDRKRMISLVHKTCKFGTSLALIFVIPLALEIEEVMILWLVVPPPFSGRLCFWLLVILVLDSMTTGHWVAISANGKVAAYQTLVGLFSVLSIPIAWMLVRSGLDVRSVAYSLVLSMLAVVILRIVAIKRLLGISPRYWVFRIFLPILVSAFVAAGAGCVSRYFLAPSFLRVCVTTIITELFLIPLLFTIVLDATERNFIKDRVAFFINKLRG